MQQHPSVTSSGNIIFPFQRNEQTLQSKHIHKQTNKKRDEGVNINLTCNYLSKNIDYSVHHRFEMERKERKKQDPF